MNTKTITLVSPKEEYIFKDSKMADLYDKSQKLIYYIKNPVDGKKYPKKKNIQKTRVILMI